MDVWIWFPALAKDYSDPATVESELKDWARVFEKLPRIDAVFVPGGDPHKRLLNREPLAPPLGFCQTFSDLGPIRECLGQSICG